MLQQKVQQAAQKYKSSVIEIRRHLHQYPELSFEEYKTSELISQRLSEWGIEHKKNVAGTGIIGIIKGQNPDKKVIALRADMDALPIQETNEVDYKSKNDGVMHACGHDVHTSSLLGAARILHELREEWEGTIKLIFQPGEEVLPGGASLMIKAGVLENPAPSCIIGQHVEPPLEVGKIGIRGGLFMASADELQITVRGKGGHGARPHQCIDTILLASTLIVSMQQIVSRHTNPIMPTVLTFGKINSDGGATNIIPNQVNILGTFRTFDEGWRKKAHKLMKNMAESLCASMGGECEFKILEGYPFLKNHEALTANVRKSAEEYLGVDNVVTFPPRMGGEDFAFYSQKLPACFYRLGVQNPNGTGLHTPNFDIDERAIETSIGLMAWLAIAQLQNDETFELA